MGTGSPRSSRERLLPRGRSDPGLGAGRCRYPGAFVLAFGEAARARGWRFTRVVNEVALCHDDQGEEHRIGLENLYRRARRTPRAEWPALVAEFLTALCAVEAAEAVPARLEEVADRLLPRLGAPPRGAPRDAPVWQLPLGRTPLAASLVIDYPDRMCYVNEQLVADSGQPGSSWFERACANLAARTPADCFAVIHEASGLRLCTVADAYDSSRAFVLNRLLPEHRASGFLCAAPGRDELLVLPVTAQALPHLQMLKVLAEKNYRTVPYPISDAVFWLHEDVWYPFSIQLKPGSVSIEPPPEFVEVLDRLYPDQAPPAE